MSEPNPETLESFIEAYRRIHGKYPKLRDCVDRFDGKLLGVLMAIWELSDRRAGK